MFMLPVPPLNFVPVMSVVLNNVHQKYCQLHGHWNENIWTNDHKNLRRHGALNPNAHVCWIFCSW